RIILDSWSTPMNSGYGGGFQKKTGDVYNRKKSNFLFNPGKRKYAARREELISFQFADLSAVAPFRYHTVRSLGFMIFAVCQVQNRLRCKFNETVFENMTMLFKVKSMDDAQNALKANLVNKGFIDDSLQFIPASERFQINAALVELGLEQNAQ